MEPALNQLMESFLEPPISKTGKSLLTINKIGFDILDKSKSKSNWLLDDFYSSLGKKANIVLDIGCRYDNIALIVLSKGNVVIANDIAVEQLIEVKRNATINKLEIANLYLNNKYFSYEIELPSEPLYVVMLHRVLHFLSPSKIE